MSRIIRIMLGIATVTVCGAVLAEATPAGWDDDITAAVAVAVAVTALVLAWRVERHVARREREHDKREQVLILAVARLSETVTRPQPVLRAVPAPRR